MVAGLGNFLHDDRVRDGFRSSPGGKCMGYTSIMKNYLATGVLICGGIFFLLVVDCGGRAFSAESTMARENLEKLIQSRSCKGCDLSGLTLTRMDLAGVDLEGADLSLAKLSLTNLSGANLKNTNLRGTVFGGADLSNADLRGADLRGTALDSAYHEGALFDGEFVTAKPDEKLGETDIEKEVYVADPGKPKKTPATKAVEVGKPRNLEEPSPPVAVAPTPKETAVPVGAGSIPQERPTPAAASVVAPTAAPALAPLASAPAIKKVAPVREPILAAAPPEAPGSAAAAPPPPSAAEPKKDPPVPPAPEPPAKKVDPPVALANGDNPPAKTVPEIAHDDKKPVKETAVKEAKELKEPQPGKKSAEEKPVVESGGVGEQSQVLAAEKAKKDNFSRLLDKNKCFGCDLSGLDFSGKDLEGADLEKANLTGCNLEKADLDKANLKGALLLKANLRGASLRGADLYKADLSGADLSEAKVDGAMLDNAKTAAAVGLAEVPESPKK